MSPSPMSLSHAQVLTDPLAFANSDSYRRLSGLLQKVRVLQVQRRGVGQERDQVLAAGEIVDAECTITRGPRQANPTRGPSIH